MFIVAYVSKGRSAFFTASGFGLCYVPKPWISSSTRFLCPTTPCSIRPEETHSPPGTPVTSYRSPSTSETSVTTSQYCVISQNCWIFVHFCYHKRPSISVPRYINWGDILTCFFKIRFNIIFSSLKRSVCLSLHVFWRKVSVSVTGRPIRFWVLKNYLFSARSLYEV